MKRWIDDGRIGELSLAEANFSNERGLELTTEDLALLRRQEPGRGLHPTRCPPRRQRCSSCSAPVIEVTAKARKLFTDAEVPDAVMAILEFESGAWATSARGWASPGIYTINLQGTKANLTL